MTNHETSVSPEAMNRLARLCMGIFIQRWDLYARQLDDGSYVCIRQPISIDLMLSHLRGEITLGSYVLDTQSRARYTVLDADDEAQWQQLLVMSQALAQDGIPSYLEASRRGGHVWFFFHKPIMGQQAQAFGRGLLKSFRMNDVEIFPKQTELGDGPGSLIRLPFGIHRRTDRRYGFITPDGAALASSVREQIRLLSKRNTVSAAQMQRFERLVEADKHPAPQRKPQHYEKADFDDSELATAPVSERIKASITVREFVSRYVELSATGRGLCPFHDDQHVSFSISEDDKYWHCFACGNGGSIIDFWMQWKQCDFRSAVKELADLLLS